MEVRLREGAAKSQRETGQKARFEKVAAAKAPRLRSGAALVLDQESGTALFEKNSDAIQPIASITKLMTAMVVLDAKLPMDEEIRIEKEDVDRLRGSHSRLPVGSRLPRSEMLRLALMASENRAAAALARTYPGGDDAFVTAMNLKAVKLGMADTQFVDSTGLHSENVSTARDLVRLVEASSDYPEIRDFTTTTSHRVDVAGKRRSWSLSFRNSNALVANRDWDIGVSKTGYISEAGRCLVMQANIAGRDLVIVLLDSWGKLSRIGDANRIRRWLESGALDNLVSG